MTPNNNLVGIGILPTFGGNNPEIPKAYSVAQFYNADNQPTQRKVLYVKFENYSWNTPTGQGRIPNEKYQAYYQGKNLMERSKINGKGNNNAGVRLIPAQVGFLLDAYNKKMPGYNINGGGQKYGK